MSAEERRRSIESLLGNTKEPISASKLAAQFSVSRQIIVGDIALLRAAGIEISATPRGYILEQEEKDKEYKIACRHTPGETADELNTIVDLGGAVIDVIVDHSFYGQLSAPLHIYSRYDVDAFIEKTKSGNSSLLSVLTSGIHLHTISCKTPEIYERIKKALAQKGMLYQNND